MPAPKGNQNGVNAWYKPLTDAPSVQLAVRVSKAEAEEIDAQLLPGQSRSEWLRNAITLALNSMKQAS